jgi:anti-anti-sigma factor
MTCEINEAEDGYYVRGEMTIYNAATLKESLFPAVTSPAGPRSIDLAEVSDFDTAGLQLLMMAQRECVARGLRFSVRNPSPAVRQALELLRPLGLVDSSLDSLDLGNSASKGRNG